MADTHADLLTLGSVTHLPEDPAYDDLIARGRGDFLEIVKAHPDSLLCWALLAEGSLNAETLAADIAAYAYARTGYHRGLDALRRRGWRGSGAVPWAHVPNQGFLRSLWALSRAAARIGEFAEAGRCTTMLREASPEAYDELSAQLVSG